MLRGSFKPSRLTQICVSAICVSVCAAGLPAMASAATSFGTYGEEAEQLKAPVGLAVDASGDVYVGDASNNRVDKFDASGNWLRAWGDGVLNGAGEMQTCTNTCLTGQQFPATEAFEINTGIAVDNDPLSSSYGDVYVHDKGHDRIEKFSPEGQFILMIGGKVNENGEDICRAGEKCELNGQQGTANGEFSYRPSFSSYIATGPGGAVYVGDLGRVQVFESTGVWKENISLSGLSTEGGPTALAVDASGDVFVKDEGVAGVHEFAPNGTELNTTFNQASTTVSALATDPAGHLFVGDSLGGFHVLEYDSAGTELESFAANTVSGENRGIAFSSTTGEIYAADGYIYGGQEHAAVWAIPVPQAGAPLIDGELATPEPRGASTLEGEVNPEDHETTVHFEYVDQAHFDEGGYAAATSTAPTSIGSGFGDQVVTAHPTLTPGTVYHFRVIATSSAGTATGADETFQETPPALIKGPWASDVAGTSVTLGARIDPLGAETTYRLEYGADTSYGQVLSGSVGAGNEFATITRHIQGLEPVATYHYRVVTSNEFGMWQSEDRTFSTQSAAGELRLPDGRMWEMVTPANKHGAIIGPELVGTLGEMEAASDGHGITFAINEPITEAAPTSNGVGNQIVSLRGSGGWSSHEVGVALPVTEEPNMLSTNVYPPLPLAFSSDLSQILVEPGDFDSEPLAPEATERTLYLQNDATGTYLPLVTPADVPSGTKIEAETNPKYGIQSTIQQMYFLAATPDFSHIVFRSPRKLTTNAIEDNIPACADDSKACPLNLYEWSGGQLKLVDVMPDGKPMVPEEYEGAELGRANTDTMHAVSNDGRRIAWSRGSLNYNVTDELFLRDTGAERTWRIGGESPRFETMSEDGSVVFYWEAHELFAYDVESETTTSLTAGYAAGEHNGGARDGFILLANEDGSYAYFVATGALAPGAVGGEQNLYVAHHDGSGWQVALVATLSRNDEMEEGQGQNYSRLVPAWFRMSARVSPNGRYMTFMSSRSLTGYDNVDALSEQPDEEVYLYDAVAHRLVCASCNPTGARPVGMLDSSPNLTERPAGDHDAAWEGHWLAADVPGIRRGPGAVGVENVQLINQPRYLSNSGRLFFNSTDALVPQDTNGLMDVYQYEPAGVGSCEQESETFDPSSGGCVDLISSGTSSKESEFMDASENGDDVFFSTTEKLVAEDYDTNSDVYDAHVCSAAVPCRVPLATPPPCSSGDSCKGAPSSQPELFGSTPSETFNGTGDVGTKLVRGGQHAGTATHPCRHGQVRRRRRCVKRSRKRGKRSKHAKKVSHHRGTRRGK